MRYNSDSGQRATFLQSLDEGGEISPTSKIVVENCLRAILPNDGSINGDWNFEFLSEKILAHSTFECVDDNGVHDSWLQFTIGINKDLSFDIDFCDPTSEYIPVVRYTLENVVGEAFSKARTEVWSFGLLAKDLSNVIEKCEFMVN